jgi:putative ABC transport system permease protein
VNNLIDHPLNRYYSWFEGYRIEMLAYSLPVIAVGFYLGMVGVELATSQKRRSLGIIKSRGASNKQVFTSLIMESAVLGIIAGAVGIVLGVVVSRFFLTIVPGARNLSSDLDFFRLNISATSILWGVLFAVLLLVMASIRPAKRISKTPIIESIHQHTEFGKKQEYKKGLDIFLVSFAIFAFIVVSEINLDDIDFSQMGQVFTVLIFITYIGSVIWLPFSPFFLMFSLTRLLTRGTDKVYKFFSRAVKPFSKDLWYIIHKNLTKNPKKVSMVSIIIALALGFGVFMTAMIGTTVHGQELEAKAKIGGDLLVQTYDVNRSFETILEKVPDVKDTVAVNSIYGYMISGDELATRRVVVFDSTDYRDHIQIDDHFFIEGNAESALKSLKDGRSVIVGEEIAKIYSLHVGDVLRIEDPSIHSSTGSGSNNLDFVSENFKVVGIVRALPGLEMPAEGPDYYIWGVNLYIDFSAIQEDVSDTNMGWWFLVDVNGDSKEVEISIQENFTSNVARTENLKTALDDINNNLSSRSVLYLMFVNIGFMIIIITVGLALIMFISIGERKNEFATIMARGAEGKQMFVLIVGEALAITLVGIVVGVFSGLFTAYTFNRMLSSNTIFGISGSTLSDRSLVVPWYTILIIILALLALLITSLIAAYKVKRIKLHSALRIRGG